MAEVEKQRPVSLSTTSSINKEPYPVVVVDFNGPDDPTDPVNWPSTRKWLIVATLASVTMTANLATIMCVPAVPEILEEFGTSNKVYLTMSWVGSPIYNTTNILFTVFSIGCATSTKVEVLVALRFFSGVSDASLALNASIAGDMFPVMERGLAITLMSFPALLGPVCGPIIGGYLTEAAGWRWVFWLCALLGALCETCFFIVYRGTYKPAILRSKAKLLRKEGKAAVSDHDSNAALPWYQTLIRTLTRPGQMLIKFPVVLILAIIVSVDYGLLFILLTTVADVFQGVYHFSVSHSGLCYLGLSIGMTIGVVLCALILDKLVARQKAKQGELQEMQKTTCW